MNPDDSTPSESPPGIDEWEVDHLRFTSFLVEKPEPRALEGWWREVAGLEERSVNIGPQGLLEAGEVDGLTLKLQCQHSPLRLDWRLEPLPPPEDQEKVPPVLSVGRLPDSLARFTVHVKRWLELPSCPRSKRLALGAVLLQPVATKEDGYRLLEPLLSPWVKIDVEGSRELNYTVNRRRLSGKIEGLEVNRLGKWLVWTWAPFRIDVRIGRSPVATEQRVGENRLACRVELDVNTVPEYEGTFGTSEQKDLYDELGEMLVEMAAKGDVK